MDAQNPNSQSVAPTSPEGGSVAPVATPTQVHVIPTFATSDYGSTQLLVELLRAQTAQFDARFDTLQSSVNGINSRLDALNGRTRKNERALVWIKTVLGAGVSAAAIAFGAFFKHIFG